MVGGSNSDMNEFVEHLNKSFGTNLSRKLVHDRGGSFLRDREKGTLMFQEESSIEEIVERFDVMRKSNTPESIATDGRARE